MTKSHAAPASPSAQIAGFIGKFDPAVAALIDAAVAQAEPPLPRAGRGGIIIKSISKKQRPRKGGAGRRA